MRLRLLCEGFSVRFTPWRLHFGGSLMLALVKGPAFYFLQMCPKLLCSDLQFWFRFRV